MNIDKNNLFGLPDEKALEKLANEYFSSLPGGFSNHDVIPKPSLLPDFESLIYNRNPSNLDPTPGNLQGSYFSPNGATPPSLSGAGISPPSLNGSKPVDGGAIPKSVAGSGISPSAIEQGNAVNMNNPQSSLPDPHFASNGGVPKSVAGSGISPSALKTDHSTIPAHPEITNILSSITSFANIPQIPGIPMSGGENASYNFLPNSAALPFNTDYNPFSSKTYIDVKQQSGWTGSGFDANVIKKDFPILQEKVHGRQLIWLDNAATTQKPNQVIDRLSYFYKHENSNIHRAAHDLAARATDAYEGARKTVKSFLNAASENEIVFVRGTTEAINLVAKSWGDQNLKAGDEIIISHLEHHANIVPWQMLAKRKDLKIRVIPVDDDGQIILEEYSKLLGPKTRLVAFTQVSNALGTITPARAMIEMAHQVNAKVLLDGAQSVSHMRVDMQDLDCDWFVFSGHKIFGPTGIGVLYGKEDLLNETAPWQGGGNMIKDVTLEQSTYQNAPTRFEAGTGNIADAVGLGAALDYVMKLGIDVINQYEHWLLVYATRLMLDVPGLRMIGTAADKASVLSFVLEGYKTEEVGAALNEEGIAVRSGHHCAQPILRRFGLEATVRPSLAFYNTCSDVDMLVSTLWKLKQKS